jgi:hypothetical protein
MLTTRGEQFTDGRRLMWLGLRIGENKSAAVN